MLKRIVIGCLAGVAAIVATIALLFALTVGWILSNGLIDHIEKSDVALIFGAKVYPSGRVSQYLAARLDKGIELYQRGIFNKIIVSGGAPKGRAFNEAVAMKNYLVAHQIPAEAILLENASSDTQTNAKNSAALMRQNGFKSVLIISQYFHIARARLALTHCGIAPIYHAHANSFEWRDRRFILREVIAFYVYWFWRDEC